MNDRGAQLQDTANRQISELTGLISTRAEAVLPLPCPGREKLGDGTVAACAMHTADNYHWIAAFLNGLGGGGRHRLARLRHHHGADQHQDDYYSADNINLQTLLERLSAGRGALSALADLTDEQLDTVPPASEMRFCDGQRTLDQVVTSMLKHQSYQLDALKAASAEGNRSSEPTLAPRVSRR
ncbi:MAG: hypothetical protein ACYDHH_22105 [Solirubrobacteraceae bacterium]